jgi:hypothetical protein
MCRPCRIGCANVLCRSISLEDYHDAVPNGRSRRPVSRIVQYVRLRPALGTFRWELQPFCNVIMVNVTQQGAIYVLDGTDDRCGNGNQSGSAVGIGYLTPQGLVGFGITTVLPGGTPVHTEATLSLSSLGGTWRDSAGNSGAFVFNGALPGATPRPIPSGGIPLASITNIHIANNAVTTANIVDASITSVDILDAPRAQFAGGRPALPAHIRCRGGP